MRFYVIADQALKDAPIVTFLLGWLDDRKQHRETAFRTVMSSGQFFGRIKTMGLRHGVPSNGFDLQ
jgi:hypothetical protein